MEARKAVAYRPNSTSLKSMAISSGLVESPASKHPLVLKLRNDLCSRGIDGAGFAELYRRLNVLDKDGSKTLTFEELRVAIQRCDLDFSSKEVSKVFSSFDSHDKGYIDIEDFMQELRGPISKFRRNLIQKAFHKIDTRGKGVVSPEDLINCYDPTRHPDVVSGVRKAKDIYHDFLQAFEVGGEIENKITKNEFVNYYNNVSAAIDDEEYFALVICTAWSLSDKDVFGDSSMNHADMPRSKIMDESSGRKSYYKDSERRGHKSKSPGNRRPSLDERSAHGDMRIEDTATPVRKSWFSRRQYDEPNEAGVHREYSDSRRSRGRDDSRGRDNSRGRDDSRGRRDRTHSSDIDRYQSDGFGRGNRNHQHNMPYSRDAEYDRSETYNPNHGKHERGVSASRQAIEQSAEGGQTGRSKERRGRSADRQYAYPTDDSRERHSSQNKEYSGDALAKEMERKSRLYDRDSSRERDPRLKSNGRANSDISSGYHSDRSRNQDDSRPRERPTREIDHANKSGRSAPRRSFTKEEEEYQRSVRGINDHHHEKDNRTELRRSPKPDGLTSRSSLTDHEDLSHSKNTDNIDMNHKGNVERNSSPDGKRTISSRPQIPEVEKLYGKDVPSTQRE